MFRFLSSIWSKPLRSYLRLPVNKVECMEMRSEEHTPRHLACTSLPTSCCMVCQKGKRWAGR